jgi:hypothetical protein
MNIPGRNLKRFEQCLMKKAVIACGMLRADTPFIRPEKVDLRPRQHVAVRRDGHQLIETSRSIPPGERQQEATGVRHRFPAVLDQILCTTAKELRLVFTDS